nr:Error-prone repair protein ImuA [Pedobacter sp. ASV19]
MERAATKSEIVEKLQQQILSMQGFRQPSAQQVSTGLGPLEAAFPNKVFPAGAIHEFLSPLAEDAAATTGFMAGLLSRLMAQGGPCLWIGTRRTLFPPALKLFGVDPDRIIFIDVKKEKDLLWTIEEALKCDALSAVVGEVSGISFMESRRLQLAVEQSRVTGMLRCSGPDKIGNTTSVARWKITPLASALQEDMPGVGYPRWNVELLKIRNGKPGTWQLQWAENYFQHLSQPVPVSKLVMQQTG